MKLTNVLSKGRKLKYHEPVPFQASLPLKLKPLVSGKGGKISDVCCIYEMSLMLACLKDNEFGESGCGKEIENFKNCYINHLTSKKNKQDKEAKGILIPGEKNLSPKQVNSLLKCYPTF